MIYLSMRAAGFIGTLSETLSKGVVKAEITLKDGKEFTTFTDVDSKGISVKVDNHVRKVFWGEITTSSVLDLHKLIPTSKTNRTNLIFYDTFYPWEENAVV